MAGSHVNENTLYDGANFTPATSTTVMEQLHLAKKNLINFVNFFQPALKYTWEITETSVAFLDIEVSIKGNGLAASVHYKPTDSNGYLLYSSSHPSHMKNAIPYILNFLYFDVCTAMTLNFPTNRMKYADRPFYSCVLSDLTLD